MKIITEKREVIGIIKTSLGMYYHLGKPTDTRNVMIGPYEGCTRFHVIDDEGFENYIWSNVEFIVVPLIVPEYRDVKVALTDEEAQDLDKAELISDEPIK